MVIKELAFEVEGDSSGLIDLFKERGVDFEGMVKFKEVVWDGYVGCV